MLKLIMSSKLSVREVNVEGERFINIEPNGIKRETS